ncbi:FUSC family protein [Streptomyces sp. NPDC059740]|uniref:FUSC family protein n=1 Tax=Streptomyces sp. NPDC059740 TaxID=3346926 RepID=UPI003662C03D
MTTPATTRPDTTAGGTGRAASRSGSIAPHRVGGPRRWWDWVLAADPGLGQLQSGWRSLVSMVTSLAVGYGMSVALGVPAMLGMMVGGMMGLMSAFAVAENTPLRLTRAILWMPFPYSAVLPLSAWLAPHRPLELTLMGAALALTFFLARFGTMYLLTGMMLFNAFMVGMMAGVPLALCDKMFVIALVSAAAVLVARLLLCYPMPREDLLRTQRAFVVQARRVAEAATKALDPDADHEVAVKRMRRHLRQLNVTTVTIDGRLAQPEVAADPDTAELLHQHLFDAELALQGIGQSVSRLARLQVPPHLREAMVVGLVIARDTPLGRADALRPAAQLIQQQAAVALDEAEEAGGDHAEAAALARRVGHLLDSLADSLAHWLDLGWNGPKSRAKVPFQPTVALEQNRPAGTGAVARRVSAAQNTGGWRKVIPYLRLPLHAAVAVAIVCPITDWIDPRRFYWGLVGVMITLFGTNTTQERLRKFGHRMVGTIIGAVLGVVLLHVIGPGHVYWTLAVIVAGLTFGAWGIQRAYAYWVIGLVTALVQLYGMSTPYNGMEHLLAERLLDNGLGILIATACAALIFPVSSRKIAQEAERGYVSALEHLISEIVLRWKEPEAPVRLRGAARGVDAALFQLRSVARPLVNMPGVRGRGAQNRLALLTTATGHARALAAAADIDIDLAPHLAERVERITGTFSESLAALDRHFATGDTDGRWVRVSPLIRELESLLTGPTGPRAARLHTALRELAALDEVLASFADNRGLGTTTISPSAAASRAAATADRAASRLDQRTQAALAAWAAHTRRPAAPVQPTGAQGGRPVPGAQVPPATPGVRATTSHVTPAAPASPAAPAARPASVPAGAVQRDLPTARPAATATAAPSADPRHTDATEGAVTVSGSLRCPDHPTGCDAWITVVSDRGKRHTSSRAVGGQYRISGLRPGGYTLIASATAHAPSAEFLSVTPGAGDLHHDIQLEPAQQH